MARRHESLIPLSRQHHNALVLCLRIRKLYGSDGKGFPGRKQLDAMAREAVELFDSALSAHFKAEEEVLFLKMKAALGTDSEAGRLLAELEREHLAIQKCVEALRDAGSEPPFLREFSSRLEDHVWKEERVLFPLFERLMPPPLAEAIGPALQERLSPPRCTPHPG